MQSLTAKWMMLAVAGVIAAMAVGGAAQADSPSVEKADSTLTVDEERQAAETRLSPGDALCGGLQLAARGFGVDLAQPFLEDETTEAGPFATKVRRIFTGDNELIDLAPHSGTLLWYANCSPQHIPPALTAEDAIPRSQALHLAKQILGTLGLQEETGQPEILYLDKESAGRDDDLIGAQWHVRWRFECRGVPFWQSYVSFRISAYDGKLLAYEYRPIRALPRSTESTLSPCEASANAQAFIRDNSPVEILADAITFEQEPRKMIAYANTRFESPGQLTRKGSYPVVCWVIDLRVRDSLLFVLVDGQTGEVIGGM